MAERDNINFYRKKILEDRLFASSGRNVMLLDYLITKALEGESLKEYTIGSDLFKKNYKADHNDGIVRVHIYNLRKKLQEYYKSTGTDDMIQFLLAKGDYNIQFIDRAVNVERSFKRRNIAFISLIVAIVCAIVLFFVTKPHYYCWHKFLKSDLATNCVLADQIIILRQRDGFVSGFTSSDIVSVNDFAKYASKNPTDSLTLANYTTYTKAVPSSVQRLTQWFTQCNRAFVLVNESDFTINDSRSANTLYIGQFKTMNISRELFLKSSKKFGVEGRCFYSIDGDGGRIIHYPKYAAGKREYEYAMVSYVAMDGGFDALYFTSNNDIGTMGVVSKFTDKKFLKEFYRQMPSERSYFNALFKIEGINRTDLNCELIELEIID